MQEKNHDMKKYLASAALIALSLGASAQESSEKVETNVTTKLEINTSKPTWSRLRGMDLGFSQVVSDKESYDLIPGKSLYWGFNMANFYKEIGGEKQGFEAGFGMFFQSRTFDNIQPTSFTADEINDSDVDRFKQKYRSFGLQVPAVFTFNLGDDVDKSFFVSAGVVGKYYLTTSYKEKLFIDGERDVKKKSSGNFGLEPFQVDFTLRAGVGDFAVFTQYGLTNLYSKGEDANLFTFGIAGLF
tara:strand:- start:30861 stop:31589 length:729 start_codon:yes stop_codon:yes gene_type:complete